MVTIYLINILKVTLYLTKFQQKLHCLNKLNNHLFVSVRNERLKMIFDTKNELIFKIRRIIISYNHFIRNEIPLHIPFINIHKGLKQIENNIKDQFNVI